MLQQLRVSGTSAMLRMMHAAHPTRIPYNELYSRHRGAAPPDLAALQPNDFVEGLVLALGIPERSYELGHTMIFFKHGAASELHALDGLTREELAARLHAAVADFASHSAARRVIQRGVTDWVRWRRVHRARERRQQELQAKTVMSGAVAHLRKREERRAAAEERRAAAAAARHASADERATVLRTAHAALIRLKQVWHNPSALDVALKAAESVMRSKSLPAEFVDESKWGLSAAHSQLKRLQAFEEEERQLERQSQSQQKLKPAVAGAQPSGGSSAAAFGGGLQGDAAAAVAVKGSASPHRPSQASPAHTKAVVGSSFGTSDASGGPTAAANPASGGISRESKGDWLGDGWLGGDPLLRGLKLPRRDERPEFAERLHRARPPVPAPPLRESALWASMICGHGGNWPAARQLRRMCLCISQSASGVDLERRLLTRDVLPYLQMLCRRLDVEFEITEPLEGDDASLVTESDVPPSERGSGYSQRVVASLRNSSRQLVAQDLLTECSTQSMGTWYVALVGEEEMPPTRLPTTMSPDQVFAIQAHLAKQARLLGAQATGGVAADDYASDSEANDGWASPATKSIAQKGSKTDTASGSKQAAAERAEALRETAGWLQRAYHRDYNAAPDCFVLLPQSSLAPPDGATEVESTHVREIGAASAHLSLTRAVSQAPLGGSSYVDLAAHQLVAELQLASNGSRYMHPLGRPPNPSLQKALPPARTSQHHPTMLIFRSFIDAPHADGQAHDSNLRTFSDVVPSSALHRFHTPWHAGGLEPNELPAHRSYLRRFADDVSSALADSLIDDAQKPAPLPSAFEDELAVHLCAVDEHTSCTEISFLAEAELREVLSFMLSPVRATGISTAETTSAATVTVTATTALASTATVAPAGAGHVSFADDAAIQASPRSSRVNLACGGLLGCFRVGRLRAQQRMHSAGGSEARGDAIVRRRREAGEPSMAHVSRPVPVEHQQLSGSQACVLHLLSSMPAVASATDATPSEQAIPLPKVMLLSGEVGSGKSTTLSLAVAAVARLLGRPKHTKQMKSRKEERALVPAAGIGEGPVVCIRFVGLSAASSHVPTLLLSICTQVAVAYGHPPPRPDEVKNLPSRWHTWLEHATRARPLLLVLDGVDALLGAPLTDGSIDESLLRWLPRPAPSSHVVVLLSCSTHNVSTIRARFQGTSLATVQLPALKPQQQEAMLKSSLANVCRTVQLAQSEAIMTAAGGGKATAAGSATSDEEASGGGKARGTGSPLHLQLLAALAQEWAADMPVPASLPTDPRAASIRLLEVAEAEHSEPLVRATCGLLCVARDGLSAAELQHLLSAEDQLLVALLSDARRAPHMARLPPALLQLLLRTHLKPLLTESLARAYGGAPLLRWRHALFATVAKQRYAGTAASAARWHRALANFWTGVQPTPLPSIRLRDGASVTLPADRGLPTQPLQLACEEGKTMWYNRRAMRELPTHLLGSSAYDELAETLINHAWLSTKLSALGLAELIEDFWLVSVGDGQDGRQASEGGGQRRDADDDDGASHAIAEIRALGVVLYLCAREIEAEPTQLASLLLARLPHHIQAASLGAPNLEGLQLQLDLSLARRISAGDIVLKPLWPCLPGVPKQLQPWQGLHASSFSSSLEPPSASTALCLDVSSDGGLVVCGFADGSARLLDRAGGDERHLLLLPPAAGKVVRSIALSAADGVAVTCTEDGQLRTHSISLHARQGGVPVRQGAGAMINLDCREESKPRGSLLFARAGLLLSAGEASGGIQAWEVHPETYALTELAALSAHRTSVRALAASADGTLVASGDGGGGLIVWSASGSSKGYYTPLTVLPTAHDGGISAIAVGILLPQTSSEASGAEASGAEASGSEASGVASDLLEESVQVTSTELTRSTPRQDESTENGHGSWSLDAIMGHDSGLSALRAFCKAELSEESISFLLDAQAWRRQWAARSNIVRKGTASELMRQYLQPNAPMEVSLPGGGFSLETPLGEAMFDSAMAHMKSTLTLDILPRFEESEEGVAVKAELAKSGAATAAVTVAATRSSQTDSTQATAEAPRFESGNSDAEFVVSGGEDGTLEVWGARSGRHMHTLCGHAAPISCVDVSAAAALIVSSSAGDGTVRTWDLMLGVQLSVLPLPDAATLDAAALGAALLRLLPTASKHAPPQALYAVARGGVALLDLGASRHLLLDHSYRGHLTPLGTPLPASTSAGHQRVGAVALDVVGRTALSAAAGNIRRWDVESGALLGGDVPHGHACEISALALDAEGTIALAGGVDGSVSCWEVERSGDRQGELCKQPMLSLPPAEDASHMPRSVLALALTETGLALAVRADGTSFSWAWAGGVGTLQSLSSVGDPLSPSGSTSTSAIAACAIAHDGGASLAAALVARVGSSEVEVVSMGGSGQLGMREHARCTQRYVRHDGQVSAVAVCGHPAARAMGRQRGGVTATADSLLAASTSNSSVHVWRVSDGAPIVALCSEDGPLLSCVSFRGGHLLTGSGVGVLGLYLYSASTPAVDAGALADEFADGSQLDGSSQASEELGGSSGRRAVVMRRESAYVSYDGDWNEIVDGAGEEEMKKLGTAGAAESKTAQSSAQPKLQAADSEEARRFEAQEAAAELQQQLEFLQRGARATEAERELQAKKTPAAQLPRGQLLDHSLPPSAPAFDLMLSWGLDTPAASERSGVGGGGRDAAGELSDEGEGGEDFELIVMTPPLGSPLNTDRSQDDEPTDRRDIRQLL